MTTLSHFEKITKKSKRKQFILIIATTSIVVLCSIFLAYKMMVGIVRKNGENLAATYNHLSQIAYPNIYSSGRSYNPTGQFSGIFTVLRYKNIDGIRVPFENYEKPYAINSSLYAQDLADALNIGDGDHSLYTAGHQYKVPAFFNVNRTREDQMIQLTQDISLTKEMPGQAVEVAVTFDKPYTLEEIEQLIPQNLRINWYWIGTMSKIDTSMLDLDKQFGMIRSTKATPSPSEMLAIEQERQERLAKNPDADVSDLYDTSTISDVKNQQNQFEYFRENLQSALDGGYIYGSTEEGSTGEKLEYQEEVKNYLAQYKTGTQAKFSGVILTGQAENFAQLENADWIYASQIGQSVRVEPFHQLEK